MSRSLSTAPCYFPARCHSAPRAVPLLLLAGLAAVLPAWAQQLPGETLRVEVGLVNVEVAVVGAEGEFIADLKPENFRLLEEEEAQTISHFAPVEAPVRIALLLEASPAVFLIRQDHLTAATYLLAGLGAQDEVALLTYARGLRVESGFTRDKQAIQHQLHTLGRYGLGMADIHLLDAVANTVDWLSPPPRRTAVVILGTGLDSGSAVGWNALAPRLGASQLTFFAVATGALLRGEPDPKAAKKSGARRSETRESEALFREADERLERLAQESAGEAYFPRSADALPALYARLASRLRNLYSLGYYPSSRAQPGSYRHIRVELVDSSGGRLLLRDRKRDPITYRVFARPGYFTAKE